MGWRHTPGWITFGGFMLAANAGYVNVIGFLGVGGHAWSHATGQVTRMAAHFGHGDGASLARAGLLVLWFLAGAVLSGVIIQGPELTRRGRRYGISLAVEAVLLGTAAALVTSGRQWGENLAVMACGLQNAMASSYAGAVVRTTHVTGLVTDLGIIIGHWLRGQPAEAARVRLLATLFFGFLAGGIVGAVAFDLWAVSALWVPAWSLLIAGVVWFVISHSGPDLPRREA